MCPVLVDKSDKNQTRCATCEIRSYSFCRCLKDDQLNIFSKISSEKEFKNKQTVFLQEEESNNLNLKKKTLIFRINLKNIKEN